MHRGGEARRAKPTRLCTLLLFLAVSSCTIIPDSARVTPLLREQITGDTWRACLAREYQTATRWWVRNGRKWEPATRLAAKAWASLEGGSIATEPVPSELAKHHEPLAAALLLKNRNPCACAQAQARFDAWMITREFGAMAAEQALADSFIEALGMCTQSR